MQKLCRMLVLFGIVFVLAGCNSGDFSDNADLVPESEAPDNLVDELYGEDFYTPLIQEDSESNGEVILETGGVTSAISNDESEIDDLAGGANLKENESFELENVKHISGRESFANFRYIYDGIEYYYKEGVIYKTDSDGNEQAVGIIDPYYKNYAEGGNKSEGSILKGTDSYCYFRNGNHVLMYLDYSKESGQCIYMGVYDFEIVDEANLLLQIFDGRYTHVVFDKEKEKLTIIEDSDLVKKKNDETFLLKDTEPSFDENDTNMDASSLFDNILPYKVNPSLQVNWFTSDGKLYCYDNEADTMLYEYNDVDYVTPCSLLVCEDVVFYADVNELHRMKKDGSNNEIIYVCDSPIYQVEGTRDWVFFTTEDYVYRYYHPYREIIPINYLPKHYAYMEVKSSAEVCLYNTYGFNYQGDSDGFVVRLGRPYRLVEYGSIYSAEGKYVAE